MTDWLFQRLTTGVCLYFIVIRRFYVCLRTICQGIRGGPGADQKAGGCRNAQAPPGEFIGSERQRDHCTERGIDYLKYHYLKIYQIPLIGLVILWDSYTVFTHMQRVLLRTQQELHRRYEGTPESTKTKALQTVIDMKARLQIAERNVFTALLYTRVRELLFIPSRMQKSIRWSEAWETWRRSYWCWNPMGCWAARSVRRRWSRWRFTAATPSLWRTRSEMAWERVPDDVAPDWLSQT